MHVVMAKSIIFHSLNNQYFSKSFDIVDFIIHIWVSLMLIHYAFHFGVIN